MRELDSGFILNEASYAADFLPVYKKLGISPHRLLQFPIILPFQVPFKNGLSTTFALDSGACTLTFSSISALQAVHAGVLGEDPVRVPQHRTRVEMTYISENEEQLKLSEEALTTVFEMMVSKLNSVITAYMVISKDYRVYPVAAEMFEFGSIYRLIDPTGWHEVTRGIFLIHWQVPFEKPELAPALHGRIVLYATVIERGLNPFVLTEELNLSARRQLLGGAYREAVIFAQTAVETLLSGVLAHAMVEEGSSLDAVNQFMQETAFMRRVRNEYHSRFGGLWNPDRSETEIARWYAKTYGLRNRIVHSGYRATRIETAEALEAAQAFQRYILDLIKSAKTKYPSLQKFFFDGNETDKSVQQP